MRNKEWLQSMEPGELSAWFDAEHVDELLRQHEFANLKGLIYFTDGYGTFPNDPPAYDAALIFLDQGYELPEVPVWAIKMILKEDEIREF